MSPSISAGCVMAHALICPALQSILPKKVINLDLLDEMSARESAPRCPFLMDSLRPLFVERWKGCVVWRRKWMERCSFRARIGNSALDVVSGKSTFPYLYTDLACKQLRSPQRNSYNGRDENTKTKVLLILLTIFISQFLLFLQLILLPLMNWFPSQKR